MISKELFCEAVRELQRAYDYQEGLNDYFSANNVDGYVFQPDCSMVLIKVLEDVMNASTDDVIGSDLSYFCYELDFGRKFKMGDVTEDGRDVDFSSPESLYDYLTRNKDGDQPE